MLSSSWNNAFADFKPTLVIPSHPYPTATSPLDTTADWFIEYMADYVPLGTTTACGDYQSAASALKRYPNIIELFSNAIGPTRK